MFSRRKKGVGRFVDRQGIYTCCRFEPLAGCPDNNAWLLLRRLGLHRGSGAHNHWDSGAQVPTILIHADMPRAAIVSGQNLLEESLSN